MVCHRHVCPDGCDALNHHDAPCHEMMHPDHWNLIMKICELVAIVCIIIFAFRMGRDIYQILREPLP